MSVLLAWLASAAVAGGLTGTVYGSPFVPASVLAWPDPSRPGMVMLVATAAPHGCADPTTGEKGLWLGLVFDAIGGDLQNGLVMGPSLKGRLEGTGHLGTLPAVGATGTASVEVAEPNGRVSLKGTLTYTLCATVAPSPSPDATLGAPTRVQVGSMAVSIQLPTGWRATTQAGLSPRWTAPDGTTTVTLLPVCPGDCTNPAAEHENVAAWAKAQRLAFPTSPDVTVTVSTDALVQPGRYDLRWTARFIGVAFAAEHLDVLRFGAGWPGMVQCSAETMSYRQDMLAAASAVCGSIAPAPP